MFRSIRSDYRGRNQPRNPPYHYGCNNEKIIIDENDGYSNEGWMISPPLSVSTSPKKFVELVKFEPNSSNITTPGLTTVKNLVEKIKSQGIVVSISVHGHTDSSGDKEYNRDLSRRRAESVKEILKIGFPNINILPIGCGEDNLKFNSVNEEDPELSRRVEIIARVLKN